MSPEIYYQPSAEDIRCSLLTDFMAFFARRNSIEFETYWACESFALERPDVFWTDFLEWSRLPFEGTPVPAYTSSNCKDALFFPNVRINYAECVLARIDDCASAITACSWNEPPNVLSGTSLRCHVERVGQQLRDRGVRPGDVVVCIARNSAELVVTALATSAIGAAFASCSADMPVHSIISRVGRLNPKILVANTVPAPWDVGTPIQLKIADIVESLISVEILILLDNSEIAHTYRAGVKVLQYHSIVSSPREVRFEWSRYPFNHPLFILFSSGTTGEPKCIVHGAGGTLLEHTKEHRLHCNLRPGQVLFFQTSSSWMMWNWQLSALASGVKIVLYEGPFLSDSIWGLVSHLCVTSFGTSAAFLQACQNEGYSPKEKWKFPHLANILSTGSILFDHQFDWVASNIKNILLQSISGGTDIIGCFLLGNPNLPIYRGELQCRSLGLDVRAKSAGVGVGLGKGELVCVNPFPSKPLGFWSDEKGERFKDTYFSENPGVWTHGDLIEFKSTGGARVYGRSDGVLNIAGVRVGPAEIYKILGNLSEIVEALAVARADELVPGGNQLVLLLVLRDGISLDKVLISKIRVALLTKGSATLVPSWVFDFPSLPRTHNGKLSEVAAHDVVNGRSARNLEALINPQCLDPIRERITRTISRRSRRP